MLILQFHKTGNCIAPLPTIKEILFKPSTTRKMFIKILNKKSWLLLQLFYCCCQPSSLQVSIGNTHKHSILQEPTACSTHTICRCISTQWLREKVEQHYSSNSDQHRLQTINLWIHERAWWTRWTWWTRRPSWSTRSNRCIWTTGSHAIASYINMSGTDNLPLAPYN